ncbi:hypothetical protein O3G_MSEX004055 [Manduca sexta]|uniref:Nose resistant-to-fluoxetine protein N-terminal domain-containing protein n=1 Tax=Manduca sexta TaxID=7130 RepID=A0A921YU56_MANSE|nr:hypothetical protein O3G_MSEX004055 [Manduca sexta]
MIFVKLYFLLLFKFASARLNFEVADTAFDQQLYEDVLDAEECDRQIKFIRRNPLLTLQFADAGIRVPRGLLQGNNVDLGNYYQCLDINHNLQDMDLQGKYCSILVPMNQTFHLPREMEFSDWAQLKALQEDEELLRRMGEFDRLRSQIRIMTGVDDGSRTLPAAPLVGTVLRLSVCIPKPCTTQQAMTSFIFNLTNIGFQYEDDFCRLPNDKPWVAAHYVAIGIFSFIGFLTILSTSYDLYCTFYLKIDRKQLNTWYTSFSMYTNGKRLTYFPSGPSNLQCLDGMRSLAMAWVIVGHTFSSHKFYLNGLEGFLWLTSLASLWISSGTITVDTFFTIAGVLIVYTTAGKMDGMRLLKNLHLFYLNRLMRMFPILAAVVLLQSSFFNNMSDGPTWTVVSRLTNNCRTYWWTTLLHVQNLLNPSHLCINHSWYVAIDVQCYILSPIVLFWVLGRKRRYAWAALTLGFLAVLVSSTIYNFIYDFQSATVAARPPSETNRYMHNYYFFTLTRAAPFFVGMIFGYVLHLHRNEKVKMPWLLAILMWVFSLGVTTTIFFHTHFITQWDWDNQLADNFINSFIRPAWGAALCWIIFACVHGYGGKYLVY